MVRLTTHQADRLGDDLLRALAPLIGDPEAINALLRHWHHVLGSASLGVVCAAAVRTTFSSCLTFVAVPPENLPPHMRPGGDP